MPQLDFSIWSINIFSVFIYFFILYFFVTYIILYKLLQYFYIKKYLQNFIGFALKRVEFLEFLISSRMIYIKLNKFLFKRNKVYLRYFKKASNNVGLFFLRDNLLLNDIFDLNYEDVIFFQQLDIYLIKMFVFEKI